MLPSPTSCPCCGGKLAKLGETITETLESIPRSYKVIQTVREKFSCRSCETITQPPAPFHPIARGRAGPDLLATIMHAKFGEHQPLNRQSERFARRGHRSQRLHARRLGWRLHERAVAAGDADRGARAGGRAAARRRHDGAGAGQGQDHHRPIMDLCARRSPVRRSGAAGSDLPLLARSRRRASVPASRRLRGHPAGRRLCRVQRPLPSRRANPVRSSKPACWAHGRRKLFVLADVAKAPLAIEAVRRIDAIFDVEREINGLSAEQRQAVATGPGRAVGHSL